LVSQILGMKLNFIQTLLAMKFHLCCLIPRRLTENFTASRSFKHLALSFSINLNGTILSHKFDCIKYAFSASEGVPCTTSSVFFSIIRQYNYIFLLSSRMYVRLMTRASNSSLRGIVLSSQTCFLAFFDNLLSVIKATRSLF
jgi:hypothetical protein